MTTLSEIKARDAAESHDSWLLANDDRRQVLNWLERGRKFLAHRETCNVTMFIPPHRCSCGFDDYVKKLYRE